MTKTALTPEVFIELFRSRHSWSCRAGSPIVKDLTDFAIEQASSPESADDLYVIFCITHGLKPKSADEKPTMVEQSES